MKIKDDLRFFLERSSESDSYIRISSDNTEISLKLASCERSIWWSFPFHNKKALRRAKRKITKLKEFVDALYDYIHQLPEPKSRD